MENKEFEKLYMNQLTRDKLYELFGVEEISFIKELEDWLKTSVELTEVEKTMVEYHQSTLLKNIKDWNEHELSLGFIGPIVNLIDFKIPYKLGFFAQRPISAIVQGFDEKQYEIIGKPDGMIASGISVPKMPYFAFQEYKRDTDNSGDPAGQNLAAMLVGQTLNEEDDIIYGCYVVGRLWYFMALKGKEFAISQDYSATHDDDLIKIVKILKALRSILVKRFVLS